MLSGPSVKAFARWGLTGSNVLLPFCVIDLGCLTGYLRGISLSTEEKTFGPEDTARR